MSDKRADPILPTNPFPKPPPPPSIWGPTRRWIWPVLALVIVGAGLAVGLMR